MMDNSLSSIATDDNDSGSKMLKKLVIKSNDSNEQTPKVQYKPHPPSIPNYMSRRGRIAVHPLTESYSSASDNDQDNNRHKERNTTTKRKAQNRKKIPTSQNPHWKYRLLQTEFSEFAVSIFMNRSISKSI